jgi:membrane-anchored protein YejM (alkaline phosphatase superfamily)
MLTGAIFIAGSIFKMFSLPSFRVNLHSLFLSIFSVDSISISILSVVIITMELIPGILLVDKELHY